MVRHHEVTDEGESTANWAIWDDGFLGSARQLLDCARCGDPLPAKPYNSTRHFRDVLKPTMHVLCDGCHDALPD